MKKRVLLWLSFLSALITVSIFISASLVPELKVMTPDWANNQLLSWDSPEYLSELAERQEKISNPIPEEIYRSLFSWSADDPRWEEQDNRDASVEIPEWVYRSCFSGDTQLYIPEVNSSTGSSVPETLRYNGYMEQGGCLIYFNISTVTTPAHTSVPALYILNDMTPSAKSQMNASLDAISTSDYRLKGATAYYNCHSYAWYSQNTDTNNYWLNNPSGYIGHGYTKVTSPQVGDIIAYFDNHGTPNNTSDDTLLHSGIIVYIPSGNYNGNLAAGYIVESKWGAGGLYRHNGYECPYTDYISTSVPTATASNRADYISFYRLTNHPGTSNAHSFTTYNSYGDDNYHECICNCGMVIHQPHNWVEIHSKNSDYIPEYHCTDCGAISYNLQ